MSRKDLTGYPPHIQAQIIAGLNPQKQPIVVGTPASVNGFVKTIITGEPMGKPRMTQRDKWKKRPVVVRYRQYADRLRLAYAGSLSPASVSWVAYFTMPPSWSKKKRAEMAGKLHQSKPDRDNVDKGILDALFARDECVAKGSMEKRWDDGNGARIELTVSLA